LLAFEHTAARLIDHTSPEVTKVLDLLACLRDSQLSDCIFAVRFCSLPKRRPCTVDNLLGNTDELSIGLGLMVLALPCGHPLKLLHPPPRRSCPIPKTLDTPASKRRGQVTDQTRDDTHHIPQQCIVGWMMNVGPAVEKR
jgi:hypothetical protein